MKKLYKTSAQLTNYAKTLETKTLNRNGKSLSFSGIERMLTKGAVICLHDGKTFEMDEDIFERNKKEVKQYLLNNY